MQGTAVVEAVRKAEEHRDPVVACCTLAAYHTDPAARSPDEWWCLEGKSMAESLVLHKDAEPAAPGGHIWFHRNLDHNPVVQSVYKEPAAAHNLDLAVVHNYNLLEKGGPWQSQEEHENAWGVVQPMPPYGHYSSRNQFVQEAPAACSLAVFVPNQNYFLVAVVVVDNSRNPVKSRVDSEMDRLLVVDSYTQMAAKGGDLWVPN